MANPRPKTLAEVLRFLFVDNPFFALMWREQRRLAERRFLHLGLILGFILLVNLLALVLMTRWKVPFFQQGKVLFELTVWTHLFAASIYGNYLWRRIRQFWREEVRHDLLLTGVPPLWMVWASLLFPLFMQTFVAILCLPFYTLGASLAGISWGTVLLASAVIALVASIFRLW